MNSLELFAGCGGLAYGISEAGFKHRLIVEIDTHAFSTLSFNQTRKVKHVVDWRLLQSDVREVNYHKTLNDSIDLVSGGPPCQPFSIGGSHKGPEDSRNMWPEAIRCIKEVQPKAFIFENVKGLLRPAFKEYLQFVLLQLSFPEICKRKNETHESFFARLLTHEKQSENPTYKVIVHDINTADYGAAQKRQRALVMGIRSDLASNFIFPEKTHSKEALLWSKYISGDYWQKHQLIRPKTEEPREIDSKVLKKLELMERPVEKPWVTVRDSISSLPMPKIGQELIPNHILHPGARLYIGHTGSGMDEPAKALKAGAHGVPGGENTLVDEDGSVRYFTIREMARLQGLPDDYIISGAWVNSIRQLGNAVPVQVGNFFGNNIINHLSKA